jgi:(2R)-ethylmalonyl-CoA mutase
VYQGIRLTPEQIVSAAAQEDVDCVGLSILSGSHLQLVPAVIEGLRAAGMDDVPVVLGGIIPDADAEALMKDGIAAVFTPKDYDLTAVMARVLDVVRRSKDLQPA